MVEGLTGITDKEREEFYLSLNMPVVIKKQLVLKLEEGTEVLEPHKQAVFIYNSRRLILYMYVSTCHLCISTLYIIYSSIRCTAALAMLLYTVNN